MAVVEKNKKNSASPPKGKAIKREIEIPVVVLGGGSKESAPSMKPGDAKENDFKIVADKDDLPVFSSQGGFASGGENKILKTGQFFSPAENSVVNAREKSADHGVVVPQGVRSEGLKNREGKKVHPLRTDGKPAAAVGEKSNKKVGLLADPRRKEAVMTVSVVLIASLIFFVWLVILRNNLSFSLGPQNPLSLGGNDQTLNNLQDNWDDIRAEWSNLESATKQRQEAENVNQEVVNKLKEKILNGETGGETGSAGAEIPKE